MYGIYTTVEEFRKQQSSALAVSLIDHINGLGNRGVTFSYDFDQRKSRFRDPVTSLSTSWVIVYFAFGYVQHDPVVNWAINHTGICSWHDLPRKTAESEEIMKKAASRGYENGTVCSFELGNCGHRFLLFTIRSDFRLWKNGNCRRHSNA